VPWYPRCASPFALRHHQRPHHQRPHRQRPHRQRPHRQRPHRQRPHRQGRTVKAATSTAVQTSARPIASSHDTRTPQALHSVQAVACPNGSLAETGAGKDGTAPRPMANGAHLPCPRSDVLCSRPEHASRCAPGKKRRSVPPGSPFSIVSAHGCRAVMSQLVVLFHRHIRPPSWSFTTRPTSSLPELGILGFGNRRRAIVSATTSKPGRLLHRIHPANRHHPSQLPAPG